jgi:hypothetical protein
LSPLGLNQNTAFDYSIYPNPANEKFQVKANTPIIKVEIFNQLLQLVLEVNDDKGIDYIDISTLQSAIYLVKVKDANANFGIEKLIKEN